MHILDQPIRVLKFNVRIMNCLEQWHIDPYGRKEMDDNPIVFVRDLVVMSENYLLKTPNLGYKSLKEIKSILALHHLTLGMDLTEFEKAEEWVKKEAEYLKKEKVKQLETKTLRDYFAAKAIQGLLTTIKDQEWNADEISSIAYSVADSMMKVRNDHSLGGL